MSSTNTIVSDIGPVGDWLTWSQFIQAVKDLCPNDANRLGMQNYLPKLIREAVIDLQQFVTSYQTRHETVYYPQDFASEGEASVGTLPPKSDIQSVWILDMCRRCRIRVVDFPWERRFELVDPHRRGHGDDFFGNICTLTAASVQAIELINRLPVWNYTEEKRHGLMAVDPQHETFYLAPCMGPNHIVSIHWHGRKLDFKQDEFVPFDEEASFAVASWVQAKIAKTVDRDLPREESFMRDYLLARTNLYISTKDDGNLAAK